jgi:hypothetical protein
MRDWNWVAILMIVGILTATVLAVRWIGKLEKRFGKKGSD